jgi:hypothetical protein
MLFSDHQRASRVAGVSRIYSFAPDFLHLPYQQILMLFNHWA